MRRHLFEVRGGLNLPDGLHERVPDDELDVSAGITFRLCAQLAVVLLVQLARSGAHVQLEHLEGKVKTIGIRI